MLVRNNKVLAVTFLDAEIFIFALILKKYGDLLEKNTLLLWLDSNTTFFHICV